MFTRSALEQKHGEDNIAMVSEAVFPASLKQSQKE